MVETLEGSIYARTTDDLRSLSRASWCRRIVLSRSAGDCSVVQSGLSARLGLATARRLLLVVDCQVSFFRSDAISKFQGRSLRAKSRSLHGLRQPASGRFLDFARNDEPWLGNFEIAYSTRRMTIDVIVDVFAHRMVHHKTTPFKVLADIDRLEAPSAHLIDRLFLRDRLFQNQKNLRRNPS